MQACCFGVDVKPLAVELGKLALWMLTMVERQARGVAHESDAPLLTFVDKNLRCGDSLRGVDEQAVEGFFKDVYGLGRSQLKLFDANDESLDDVLRCMFRLHQVLAMPAEAVTSEAAGLLATAGEQLGRDLEPVSDDPQDLRAQLHEVARELNWYLRWTWDLAFLYDWYGRNKDALWDAVVGDEGTTANSWVGLLGGPGKVSKKHKGYRDRVRALAAELRAFHWPLEFYDVFHREARGFDVIVANPPFLGDRDLRGKLGEDGVAYLRTKFGTKGTPDLAGFFVIQLARTLGASGSIGVIAPNTLGQAKNRKSVLQPLTSAGTLLITRACASRPWPGEAAVHILTLHAIRARELAPRVRRIVGSYDEDGFPVGYNAIDNDGFISSYLDAGPETELTPLPLQDGPIAHIGVFPRGNFDRPLSFLDEIPRGERQVLFSYLNNRDVQQQPIPAANRVIIDVSSALEAAGLGGQSASKQEKWLKSQFGAVYKELADTVRSDRENLPPSKDNDEARTYWWLFARTRPELRAASQGTDSVIVIGRTGKHLKPSIVQRFDEQLGLFVCFTEKLCVLPTRSSAVFSIFSSFSMEVATRRLCSTLKSDMNFGPKDVLPYFPFPWIASNGDETSIASPVLVPPDAVERRLTPPAQALLDLRQAILLNPDAHGLTRAQVGGPTDLYNLFDDPKCETPAIQQLRQAHLDLELAVLREYGWQDLHGPWTFDRPWLDGTWRFVPPAATRRAYLEHLATLNHERAK